MSYNNASIFYLDVFYKNWDPAPFFPVFCSSFLLYLHFSLSCVSPCINYWHILCVHIYDEDTYGLNLICIFLCHLQRLKIHSLIFFICTFISSRIFLAGQKSDLLLLFFLFQHHLNIFGFTNLHVKFSSILRKLL